MTEIDLFDVVTAFKGQLTCITILAVQSKFILKAMIAKFMLYRVQLCKSFKVFVKETGTQGLNNYNTSCDLQREQTSLDQKERKPWRFRDESEEL